jgi:Lipopolysaccharide kinase (Kdo/WaaP) family
MSRAETFERIVGYLFDRLGAVTVYTITANGLYQELITQQYPFNQPDCQLIKCEKKIKVGVLRLRIGTHTKTVYVKEHNARSLGRRVASLFLPSAAMRSLSGAINLLNAGYATAQPLGAIEYRRWGVLIKSLFFAEEVTEAKTLTAFWQEHLAALKGHGAYRKRRAFLRELAVLFSSLHMNRLYHNDLKAANLLIRPSEAPPQGVFNVIDLQGLRQCFYVSKRRRIKNMAQLNRTLGRLLSNTEKLFFLQNYNGFSLSHKSKKKELIATILAETQRQIARERAPGRSSARVFNTTHEPSSFPIDDRSWLRAYSDEDRSKPLITAS